MLAKMKLLGDMHVVTIDTLHLFPETYKLISEVHDYWEDLEDIKLYHCKRAETRRQFERMYGARLWQADAALYGYLTKVLSLPSSVVLNSSMPSDTQFQWTLQRKILPSTGVANFVVSCLPTPLEGLRGRMGRVDGGSDGHEPEPERTRGGGWL